MGRTDRMRRTVLVTDSSRGSAIAVIRSLGRAGHRVLAVDSDPHSMGFRSRYAQKWFVVPAARESAREFVEAVQRIVRQEAVDLVVPVTDLAIQPLAASRTSFGSTTILAMADDAALHMVTDKNRTLELASSLDIPVPATRRVDTPEEALAAAAEWGWPLVLKPHASHRMRGQQNGMESFQVTYAENPDDLRRKLDDLEGRCTVLLQRYCQGTGVGIELLMSRGRPLAAFAHRRRREIPLTGGASSYRESIPLDPQLLGWSVRLLQAIRWTGLAMVEFKVGGGRKELMEVNGRIWGSLPLAVASGMDFPALLATLLLEGEDAVPHLLTNNYRIGVRCRDLQRDMLWIASVLAGKKRYGFFRMPSRLRALRALLGWFNPRRHSDLLVWDDPLPGLLELPRLVPRLREKIRRKQEKPSAWEMTPNIPRRVSG